MRLRPFLVFGAVLGAGGVVLFLGVRGSSGAKAPSLGPGLAVQRDIPRREPPHESSAQEPLFVRIDGQASLDTYAAGASRRRGAKSRLQGEFHALDESFSSYRVLNLSLHTLNPETGEVIETLTADSGTFRVEPGLTSHDLVIADGGRVLLEGVVSKRLGLHAFAPLTLTAERLEAWVGEDELRSAGEELVHIEGAGLSGKGRGLVFQGGRGLLRLNRGGEVTMQQPQGDTVLFQTPTTGALEVRQEGSHGEGSRISVTAEGGARVVTTGKAGPAGALAMTRSDIQAQSLKIEGRREAGEFLIESGQALGNVVAERGAARYSGSVAEFDLGPDGRLRQLLIQADPAAEFPVQLDDGAPQRVRCSGEGPLFAQMGELGMSFTLRGPSTSQVLGGDLAIHAEEFLGGRSGSEGEWASLTMRKNVRVIQGPRRLETEVLDVAFRQEQPRGEVGTDPVGGITEFICEGPTHIFQRTEAQGLVSIDVSGRSELEHRTDGWRVNRARGVRVDVVGPRPLSVSAGVVTDFDLASLELEASEGVSWAGVEGDGSASQLAIEPGQIVRLIGSEDVAARLRVLPQRATIRDPGAVEYAALQGAQVTVSRRSFLATGEVELQAQTGEGTLTLEAGRVTLNLVGEPSDPDEAPAAGKPQPFSLEAHLVEQASLDRANDQVALRAQRINMLGVFAAEIEERDLYTSDLVASGEVHFERSGLMAMKAKGDTLILQDQGRGQLVGTEGARVMVQGLEGLDGRVFGLSAAALTWEEERIEAAEPKFALMERADSAAGEGGFEEPRPGLSPGEGRIEAASMVATPEGLRFEGGVLLQGTDEQGFPLIVRAGKLRLAGSWIGVATGVDAIQSLEASAGFVCTYGGVGRASGDRFLATRAGLTFWGRGDDHCAVEVGQALGTLELSSSYIHLDLDRFLVSCERGKLASTSATGSWILYFASVLPQECGDQTLLAMTAPRFSDGQNEARADYVGLWLQSHRWRARGRNLLWGPAPPLVRGGEEPLADPPMGIARPQGPLLSNVFRRLSEGELSRYLEAAYAEGNIEVVEDGRLSAQAHSIYLNMLDERGELEEATLVASMQVAKGRTERVRVSADQMLTAGDGSLRADKATLTTSTQDQPTYVIQTRKLVLDPRDDGLWEISARGNKLVFSNHISVPLPSIGGLALDRKGDVVGFVTGDDTVRSLDHLVVGDNARFGPMVGTAFRSDIGKIGRKLGDLLGFGVDSIGRWHAQASYLGSRGVLGGLGLEMREPSKESREDMWLEIMTRGIHDTSDDRGLVRVPVEDRDPTRLWTHARGRYPFSDVAWVDLALNTQSDPGVQSEFFQRRYQQFEERDTYLHYRDGRGADYFDAMFRVRLDSYRTDVLERPSLGFSHGERELATLGSVPVLYGAGLELDALSRRSGDPDYEFDFQDSDGLLDGLGDRDVLRASTYHRLSAPLNMGWMGVRATPWIEGRAAAWDATVDGATGATRTGAVFGVDLATTLFRVNDAGWRHMLTPTLGYTNEKLMSHHGKDLVRFDAYDDPLGAEEIGAGLRALWTDPTDDSRYDLELKGLRRFHRDDSMENQTQLSMLGSLRTTMNGAPVALMHDGRIDIETGRTLFSRSTFAWRPDEPWILQFVYRRGLDPLQGRLFEAASFDARWRIDPKWELELGEDISMAGNGSLRTHLALRRFSADFMLETTIDKRAGEGGAGISIGFSPLFLWRPKRLGILDE